MYKAIVMDYTPSAKKAAKFCEDTANEMELKGYEFVSFTVMPSAKGILLFRTTESHERNLTAPSK